MAAKQIVIEGQFAHDMLGTFRVIRGFATLQDLAKISAPYDMESGADGSLKGFQRPILPEHARDLKRYLQEGKSRFIPEVILSVRARTESVVDGNLKPIGVRTFDGAHQVVIAPRYRGGKIVAHRITVN